MRQPLLEQARRCHATPTTPVTATKRLLTHTSGDGKSAVCRVSIEPWLVHRKERYRGAVSRKVRSAPLTVEKRSRSIRPYAVSSGSEGMCFSGGEKTVCFTLVFYKIHLGSGATLQESRRRRARDKLREGRTRRAFDLRACDKLHTGGTEIRGCPGTLLEKSQPLSFHLFKMTNVRK